MYIPELTTHHHRLVVVLPKGLGFLDEAVEDIKAMRVRGAAAIARYAVEVLRRIADEAEADDPEGLFKLLEDASRKLLASRPTAVSLPNGIRFVMHRARRMLESSLTLGEFRRGLMEASDLFIERSMKAIERISEYGSRRVEDGDSLLTHCNSSAVVGILKKARMDGKSFKVFITETRPLFQGRITARQLGEEGIETYLIVDSAARYFMNEVDKVIVGADAVAANGAVVNKIGTSMIALAAHEARTQFLVAAETFKFSPETMIGELVWIEERGPDEVLPSGEREMIPLCQVRNPAFDVTPPEYIDAIITEEGVIPPQAAFHLMEEIFGDLTPEELASYKTLKPLDE
ncbi:MAG: ribose 1,5-bisphosphate isomerase [Candidatus Bathyarchaeia archaeon]